MKSWEHYRLAEERLASAGQELARQAAKGTEALDEALLYTDPAFTAASAHAELARVAFMAEMALEEVEVINWRATLDRKHEEIVQDSSKET